MTVSSATVLSGGLLVNGGSVVLPAGSINNPELENSSLTVSAGTGLTGGGAVSLGGSITINAAQDISTTSSPSFVNLTLSGNLGIGGSLVTTGNVGVGKSLSVTDLGVFNKGLNVTGLSNIAALNATTINGTTLNTTGNVGIGFTTPTANLHILNTGTGNSLRVDDVANDTSPFVINDVGNVGIANSAPSFSLDVVGTLRTSGNVNIGGTAQVTAQPLILTGYNCSGQTNGGTLTTDSSGNVICAADDGGGGGTAWSAITDPTANLSLAHGSNTTTFTWGAATGGSDLFTLRDSTNNTGTKYLLNIFTAGGSTALPLRVNAAGTEALAVSSGGNVGVGTTSLTGGKLIVSSGNTGIGFTTPTATLHVVQTGSGNVFRVDDSANDQSPFVVNSAGNVGIQNSAPSFALDVVGNSRVSLDLTLNGGNINLGAATDVDIVDASATSFTISQGTSNYLIIDTAGEDITLGNITTNPAFYFVGNGNVGVGTSSVAGAKVQVNGAGIFWGSTTSLAGPVNGLAVEGNAGIGTTSPTAKVHVVAANDTASAFTVTTAAGVTDTFVIDYLNNLVRLGTVTNGITFDVDANTTIFAGTARPSKVIVLSPEYAGATLSADGSATTAGSMTSDNAGSATAWRNYYQWTSTNAVNQDYTVIVRITLPQDFDTWETGTYPGATCALEIAYQTGLAATTNNGVSAIINNDTDTPATAVCTIAEAASATWTSFGCTEATLNDAVAPEWDAAGETAVIRIKLKANSTASALARAGDVTLRYKARF